MKKYLALIIVCAISTPMCSLAKKPDWPGGGGMGVIGFGLIELTPRMVDGQPAETVFTINYEIPAKYAVNAPNGQVVIFHASALEKFNNIPESAFLVHKVNRDKRAPKGVKVAAQVKLKRAGLYVIAYGPWDGLLTFDDAMARETYKISAAAPEGAKLRWVDQDAGDLTIARFRDDPKRRAQTIVRLRLLRAGLQPLTKEANFLIEPLKLHPAAAERVALLRANW